MRGRFVALTAVCAAALFSNIAVAQDLREFCPDRPGLGTPACTVDKGRLAIEVGLIDWARDRQPESREDTVIVGDILLRYGVTESFEAQIGWAAFGHIRAKSPGMVEKSGSTGDVLLAVRQNLRQPDGSGFSVALMPFATLPTGGSAVGTGDWGAGLLLPISRELPAGFQFGFTGSIEAAVDQDRDGRHAAYGAVIGLDIPVGQTLGATIELSARRDEDPSGAATELLSGLSAAWSPSGSLQFDIGASLGLNRHTPDLELYLGVARRL